METQDGDFAAFAAQLDVTPKWLFRTLAGQKRPSNDLKSRIMEITGLSETEIFIERRDSACPQGNT